MDMQFPACVVSPIVISVFKFQGQLFPKANMFQRILDQVARTAPRKFSTIEDTGDLKPCHNSTRKFGCRLCHLTQNN